MATLTSTTLTPSLCELSRRVAELERAIAVAQVYREVLCYRYAAEKYQSLVTMIRNFSQEDRKWLVEIIVDVLPAEWLQWMKMAESTDEEPGASLLSHLH